MHGWAYGSKDGHKYAPGLCINVSVCVPILDRNQSPFCTFRPLVTLQRRCGEDAKAPERALLPEINAAALYFVSCAMKFVGSGQPSSDVSVSSNSASPSASSQLLPLVVRQHDWFNLVAIALLIACNIRYIAHGAGFALFWNCTLT